MGNSKKYRAIVVRLLEDYAAVKSPFWPNVENQVIVDDSGNHYQLLRIGWDEKDAFVYHVVFHFDIKDEKVFVLANNTDRNIIDELVEFGIKREDVVLAFQMPRASMSEALAG